MNWLRDNGLTIVLLLLFAASLVGQGWAGWLSDAQEKSIHGAPTVSLAQYLTSGAFLSALFENWESEFMQMAAFVLLTAYLFQRGSPESKSPDEASPQDRDPAKNAHKADAPWPLRGGAFVRGVYSHSLGLALVLLFAISFVLHWINSMRHGDEEAALHSGQAPSLGERIQSSEFWFESFQNWQSEFLSTAVLIVLAIFLRERGSPESKPVSEPHEKTGAE